MLQKIFRRGRNSLTRSSAKEDNNKSNNANNTPSSRVSFKKPKLFHSKSLDESRLSGGKGSTTPPPSEKEHHQNGGGERKAPLAGKDDSFDGGGGDNNSRKVHFSPHGTLDNLTGGGGAADEKLFDDGMMKAFEVGNLSIQEFLESPHTSPDTTPATTLIKKSKDMFGGCGGGDLTRSKSLPVSPAKKPSLLDQAHAKASGSNTERLPASPALRQKVQMRSDFYKTNTNSDTAITTAHRFSKSIEELAQKVFGDHEFERQLEKATKQLTKDPLVEYIVDGSDGGLDVGKSLLLPTADAVSVEELSPLPPPKCPKSEPVNRKLSNPGAAPQRRTIHRCQSAVHHSELQVEISKTHHQQQHEMTKSVDFPSPDDDDNEREKLESWINKLDLSSSRTSNINADSTGNLRGGGGGCSGSNRTMDPVIEGVPLKSPRKPLNEPSSEDLFIDYSVTTETLLTTVTGKDRKRANSEGYLGTAPLTTNLLQQRFRNNSKLVKSDSNAATCGSDVDLNASVNSILDLNFPPPPPVVELKSSAEGSCDGNLLEDSLRHEVQEQSLPFDWEVVSSDGCEDEGRGGRVDLLQDYLQTSPPPASDPLTDSLFSVVPLPEDPALLKSALTRALSEIVSEIIGARHKLNRILKAIEIHHQILKDQSKQINTHTHQIAELRFAQFELTSNDAAAVAKLRPKMNRSSSTATRNNNARTNGNTTLARRRPQSARTYRQSREMVDLSNTLDNLLNQCSELQTSPRRNITTTTTRNSNVVVKRSNTFPSREHVPNNCLD